MVTEGHRIRKLRSARQDSSRNQTTPCPWRQPPKRADECRTPLLSKWDWCRRVRHHNATDEALAIGSRGARQADDAPIPRVPTGNRIPAQSNALGTEHRSGFPTATLTSRLPTLRLNTHSLRTHTIPTGLRPTAQGWPAARRPALGPPPTNSQPQRDCVPAALPRRTATLPKLAHLANPSPSPG